MNWLKKYRKPLGMAVVLVGVLWTSISQADTSVPATTDTLQPIQKPLQDAYGPTAPAKLPIGTHFDGEKLHYNLSLFPFFHAADAEITFAKDPAVKNGYIAQLEAHTNGLIKFLTAQRRDNYISHMVLTDDGKRLRSAKFEKIQRQSGRQDKRTETSFDYVNKVVCWKTWKGDELTGEGTQPIPENTVYDDPLVAFYNFRYGVYGDIEKGKPFDVNTLPTKRQAKLEMQVASEKETEKENRSHKSQREYLVKVMLDQDLFGQKKGDLEFWLSKDYVPTEGVVKGVLFLGDIHGVLRPTKPKQNI